ncbi:MAG: histidine-type phosphatase [Prevotella sp.]|nr:histidine-type phosphatase [Prevotella sp.]
MRKIFLSAVLLLSALTAAAQPARREIERNVRLSASNHLAYPNPMPARQAKAPDGKRPFYISHYGRHGSRFLIGSDEYDYPYNALAKADSAGALTALGRDVMERIGRLRSEAGGRLGELTPLGARQHRDIARRMYERFPEVFAGSADVDARSTVVIRCILSMENELLQLTQLNPQLNIAHDASMHDMYYMNFGDKELTSKRMSGSAGKAYDDFCRRHPTHSRLIGTLFSDTAYVSRNVDAVQLSDRLFKLASNIQNCESRSSVTLYDIFTDDELYGNWLKNNVRWYISYGACPLNGGTQPFTQRNLLRRIIGEADSCIALPGNRATLRFGHETMVLPLTCLLGINGYDMAVDDMDKLEKKGWINYRIFPMGANIQLVFYRKDDADSDVIFKVLLNENEATLPIKTDIAPFYHWKDFRRYYLEKIDSYEKTL